MFYFKTLFDFKAIKLTKDNLKLQLGTGLNFSQRKVNNGENVLPGQLFKYIIEISKEINPNQVELRFDKRANEVGKLDLIKDTLIEVLENANQATVSNMIGALNLRNAGNRNISEAKIWVNFVNDFNKKHINNFIKVVD